MKLDKELTGADLIFTALIMLKGKDGVDFKFYELDPDWWALRLWIGRN